MISRTTPFSRFSALGLGSAVALLAAACFSGCLVSFDGYQRADGGGAATGGSAEGGSIANGGAQSAVSGASGNLGTAGVSRGGASGNSGGRAGGGGAASGGGSATSGGGGATSGGGGTTSGGGGTTSGGGGGSAGSSGSAGNPPMCPTNLKGAILVEIPKPGGGIYCIDRTEATNSDYALFLASNPSPTNQSAPCTSNADFLPAVTTECSQYDPTGKPKVPVACVDWCDAQAYCKWAGKHLCGKIGGGSNAPSDFADATKSEWFDACSHAGQNYFPYGNVYDGSACVGLDNGALRPTAVPTASCQGGYDGVFDLSGNVSEWEDSCTSNLGLNDQCLYRGGSWLDADHGTSPTLLCNGGTIGGAAKSSTKARSTRDKEIGFRCCADP